MLFPGHFRSALLRSPFGRSSADHGRKHDGRPRIALRERYSPGPRMSTKKSQKMRIPGTTLASLVKAIEMSRSEATRRSCQPPPRALLSCHPRHPPIPPRTNPHIAPLISSQPFPPDEPIPPPISPPTRPPPDSPRTKPTILPTIVPLALTDVRPRTGTATTPNAVSTFNVSREPPTMVGKNRLGKADRSFASGPLSNASAQRLLCLSGRHHSLPASDTPCMLPWHDRRVRGDRA